MRRSEVQSILQTLGVRPQHALGQNFFLDERVVKKMAESSGLSGTQTVLEIGPGLGILTRELAQKAKRVVAVELDTVYAEFLKREFSHKRNVEIIEGDIVKILKENTLEKIIPKNFILVANLPYQITNYFFHLIFTQSVVPQKIVVMIQKEVAQRIVALPGAMSKLSFFTKWYAQPTFLFKVSQKSFWPMPKVHSAVVEFAVRPDPCSFWGVTKKQEEKIFRLVQKGFEHKRKLLSSNLSRFSLQKNVVQEALVVNSLSAKARAQELSVENWVALGKNLSARKQYGII